VSDQVSTANHSEQRRQVDRRTLLIGGALGAAALVGRPVLQRMLRRRAAVFVAAGQRYDGPLVQTIRDGLIASGLDPAKLRSKRVLLKPNLVEPTRTAPHVTTHPAMVLAAAEVFRSWDAQVAVAEGPGHVRDAEMTLVESRLAEALHDAQLPFTDLNYDEIVWVKNAGLASNLDGFYFPNTVADSELVVSMPKMKTHHWIGVTAAMKNLYGVMPGIKYGWPKNVLHYAGIPETVFDINASLPKTIAIVDGIECMEGDGPIMGDPKRMNLVVIGANLPAVDATVCRLMRLDPAEVGYLQLAANRLGPIDESLIDQRGEPWRPHAQPFRILDKPHLRSLRADCPQC
jgi:uncharacterized protein (DUF362 family)